MPGPKRTVNTFSTAPSGPLTMHENLFSVVDVTWILKASLYVDILVSGSLISIPPNTFSASIF